MKRILCLLLAIVCALLAASCRYVSPEEGTEAPAQNPPNTSKIRIPIVYDSTPPAYGFETDDPSNTDEVILRKTSYNSISTKTIQRNQATNLATLFNALQPTGDTAPVVSEEEFSLYSIPTYNDLFKMNTMFVEFDNKIYRISWEYSQSVGNYIESIALVEKHYGAGIYLQVTEEVENTISMLWSYWPLNYWYGTYDAEKNEPLTMKKLAKGASSVEVIVKSITFEKSEEDDSHYKYIGRITLELTSQATQYLTFYLKTQQGGDFFGTLDDKTVSLLANVPQTVEMSFSHSINSYFITTRIDNTYLLISLSNINALYSE